MQGVFWGEELAMHDPAREDFFRGESGGLKVPKMKQAKLVPLPIMELGIKRLVLYLVCELVEVGEEKRQELELNKYKDCLGEETWEPIKKARR